VWGGEKKRFPFTGTRTALSHEEKEGGWWPVQEENRFPLAPTERKKKSFLNHQRNLFPHLAEGGGFF